MTAKQINSRIHSYAVWDKAEKLEIKQSPLSASFFDGLFIVPEGVMQPDIEKVATIRTAIERVDCISLEAAVQIANAEHVDFLKIHVKGAEVEVVTGTPACVWEKIDRVGIIYHEFIRPGCAEQIISTLQANGFRECL